MYFSDYYFRPLDEMTDEDLYTPQVCGCCGAKDSMERLERFQEKPEIYMVRCKRCQAVTYDRILKQEKLNAIYESYDYNGTDQKKMAKDKVTFYGKKRFGKHVFAMIRKHQPSDERECVRMLDFGGGDGSLAYALAEELLKEYRYKKIEIVVVDYTDDPRRSEHEEITIRHCFPLASLPNDEKFEYVLASAVLEHIPQPGPEFKRLINLTKEGGLMYFRAPYKYPLFHLMHKLGTTLDMLYPRHIWDLGEKWWKRIPRCLKAEDKIKLVESRPSLVEKSFREHPKIAAIAHMMKAPWFLCHKWHFVGGWEAMYIRK